MTISKTASKLIASLIFSALVIAVIIKLIDLKDIKLLLHTNWNWLFLAFATFTINYLLRTLRFKILMSKNTTRYKDMFAVTTLYGMFNFLLPSKSGELTYLYLAKRYLNNPISQSGASLITARFFDFAIIAIFLPAIIFIIWDKLPLWAIYSATFFCLATAIASIVFLIILRKPISVDTSDSKSRFPIKRYISKLVAQLQNIQSANCYRNTFLLTLGIWISIYLNFYCISLSLGITVTLLQMIVVSIILIPLTLLPIQGIANLGAHEIGWTTAFSLFGYNSNTALTIAIGSHIILLSLVLILGGIGYIILRAGNARK